MTESHEVVFITCYVVIVCYSLLRHRWTSHSVLVKLISVRSCSTRPYVTCRVFVSYTFVVQIVYVQ